MVGMGGHMSCYGWAYVIDDGCRMGIGANSKEMLGSSIKLANLSNQVGLLVTQIVLEPRSNEPTVYCYYTK